MTWRMTYLVTIVKSPQASVLRAHGSWEFDHPDGAGGYEIADPQKVGAAVCAPIVKDNRGKPYACELFSTHYNEEQDALILVWKPTYAIEDLPPDLQAVEGSPPEQPVRVYGGE